MRVKRLACLALAALFLVQSVSAAAAVMLMPESPLAAANAQIALMDGEDEAVTGCHGEPADAPDIDARDCCDSQDEPCCLLGCAAPAPAVPAGDPVSRYTGIAPMHSYALSLHVFYEPSALYRPPRSH